MKKNIFAVCDLEAAYAYNFVEYLNRKKTIPFEIQAFTNVKNLMDYGKNISIELLLISDKAMCPEIRELEIGKIVILSEGVHLPELEQYSSVYKYQSSADVLREVMACYEEDKHVSNIPFPVWKKTTELIGVYSPIGRCLQTSFALTLGQVLAKEKTVLYLNLEEYSGLEELLGKSYRHNLSDLLYYVRQNYQNVHLKMNSMVQTIQHLDFIPPVRAPEDIRGALWEDWEKLLKEISLHSSYEVLVLDIGNGLDGLFQLLDLCGKIYMLVLDDVMSSCKIAQFENLLRIWDYPQILARIEKIRVPFPVRAASPETYLEQLLWGEFGDYVREVLRKERQK